jgi:hypothetical protein
MRIILFFLMIVTGTVNREVYAREAGLDQALTQSVLPFLKSQCLSCHSSDKPKAKLDLSIYQTRSAITKDYRVWDLVLERLEAEDMPPEKAPKHPTEQERAAVIGWIKTLRKVEADKNAGDPGPVLTHRLSNSEYDNTIRDLTGVDIRPTKEFPVDPANEAGFDNSGESLMMSPALLKKYLEAARNVADHLVLKPDGFDFAPHPAVTETDRDKYAVQRIVAFYQRHTVNYADYFMAVWRFQNRKELGQPTIDLKMIAGQNGLSLKYLNTIWAALTSNSPSSGPIGELQKLWKALPGIGNDAEVKRGCEAMRAHVIKARKSYDSSPQKLGVRGMSPGSQPLVLWRNRQLASRRMKSPLDDDKADEKEFCRVFPDAFAIPERAPYFDSKGNLTGRLLTAGFHLMQGYFRDDQPLYDLVLDIKEQAELDRLWSELNFVTSAPMRQYHDFIFFERAEPPRFIQEATFDFARAEDKDAISPAKIAKLRLAYLAKAKANGASTTAIEAITSFFENIEKEIRTIEKSRVIAEATHLVALARFAERAYRRPLLKSESEELKAFYESLRKHDGLSHEDAIRDSVTSILMSPHFCFRIEPSLPGNTAKPISDYGLASRLSYFLWSSMPDEELLSVAARGDLHKSQILIEQTRRMMRDPKIAGFAREFGGQWLAFRRFEELNSVDRVRFSMFTNELRQAMYEEPIRFIVDLMSRNGSIREFLEANHTFVNSTLAAHYGVSSGSKGPGDWVRVDDANRVGRGGLLPMSVFLTANSPGLRTSPVKRGYWVVRRLLGEHIPPPPTDVPELPKDEAKSGDLTLPQLLAQHRANKACAGCHDRFDSIGLVFEGYGPVGEQRLLDLGGRPVQTKATFPDSSEGNGREGLRRYLTDKRQADFELNLMKILLSYALGRGLLPSDDSTIDVMKTRLKNDDKRIGGLIESIVTSPQFLMKRGHDDLRD